MIGQSWETFITYWALLGSVMTQTESASDDVIADQYRPLYEFDRDAGVGFGKVVCQVPREPQIEALRSIEGEGPVEPDGWFEGYNGLSLPVINGVPITALEHSEQVGAKTEGVESSQRFAVDDALGVVELHKAFAHPENTSKVKVRGEAEE